MKTHPPKLPSSIYMLFAATIVANVFATIIVIKYLLR